MKEGKKAGRKEGRKERTNKEGRKEQRKEGRNKGRQVMHAFDISIVEAEAEGLLQNPARYF